MLIPILSWIVCQELCHILAGQLPVTTNLTNWLIMLTGASRDSEDESGPMASVVFLKGVNVGGHRTFRPSVLAREMADFGVISVGAAGTFVVRKPISRARLRLEFQ